MAEFELKIPPNRGEIAQIGRVYVDGTLGETFCTVCGDDWGEKHDEDLACPKTETGQEDIEEAARRQQADAVRPWFDDDDWGDEDG